MIKITYSKSKLDSRIINHFEESGVYDFTETDKTKFQFVFTDYVKHKPGKFEFTVNYDIGSGKVYGKNDIGVCDSEGNTVEFYIESDCNNPSKLSLLNELAEITRKQVIRDIDNAKSAKDIQDTEDNLNLKFR